MDRQRDLTNLAALLDGELKGAEAEQLHARVKASEDLRGEFEIQRLVKTSLARLPEVEAPDFMATRVLGEIAARRNSRSHTHWRTAAAALGGFSLCLLLVVGVMTINNNRMAGPDSAVQYAATTPAPAGPAMPLDAEFAWGTPMIPVNADEDAQQYLEFVSDQHEYSRRLNSTGSINRDLTGVILLLENGEQIYLSPEDIK